MEFLGIEREAVFSPGKVGADAGILRAVAAQLTAQGHPARATTLDAAHQLTPDPATLVFAMCQGDLALELLRHWETCGARVVNRPRAVLDSQRFRAIPLLQRAGVAVPETVLASASPGIVDALGKFADAPLWIKRGDVHATEPDDVVFAHGLAPVRQAIERLRARDIRRIALQRHVAGTVFKFYAVANGFFHCVVAAGAAQPSADVLEAMARLGQQGATALGLEVYGGDCVLDGAGALHLIDLNDWPSYEPCRAQAAAAIATYLIAQRDESCA